MGLLAMLRHRCTVYRQVAIKRDDPARDGWGQDNADPAPRYTETRDGAIPCYHTDTNGAQTITVGRTIYAVNVAVDLEYAADVQGGDRLLLDDGRIVDVLAVRNAGTHHKIAQCNYDSARQAL